MSARTWYDGGVPWQLPPSESKEYPQNPLEVVVCQISFEPILKVHAGVPEFQDRVRDRFPGYEEAEGIVFELRPTGPVQRSVLQHRFLAHEEPSVASLEPSSVTLEYAAHREREVTRRDARLVCDAMTSTYQRVATKRLGLRYVNRIDRDRIGERLGRAVEWSELLQPPYLRVPTDLADLESASFASEVTANCGRGRMTVRLGLLPTPDRRLAYRLDIDRYVEEHFDLGDVDALLVQFAEDIYRLFRTAAGPTLLEWMEIE